MSDYQRAPGHVQWSPEGPPPPDPVTESIRAELLARQRVGWRKYGKGLNRPDFHMGNWLHHLYEELLDAAQYSKALMMRLDGTLIVSPFIRRWRHKKRDTTYIEVGRGELQASTRQPQEGDILVAYRSDVDSKLYFRWETEFEDGRFEEIKQKVDPNAEISRAQEIEYINNEIGQLTARLQQLASGR